MNCVYVRFDKALDYKNVVNSFYIKKFLDGVFDYIESGYGIFHCEGDEVVLEDVEIFLERKGMKVNAGIL